MCAAGGLVVGRWHTAAGVRGVARTVTHNINDVVLVAGALLLAPVWLPALAVFVAAPVVGQWRRLSLLGFRIGLAAVKGVVAAVVFRGTGGPVALGAVGTDSGVLLGAVAATAVAMWVLSAALPYALLWTILGRLPRGSGLVGWTTVTGHAAAASVGALVAVLADLAPALVVLVVPLVIMLRRQVDFMVALHASQIDAKTGLANAGHFQGFAAAALARAGERPVTLLMLDLDHLRLVNNTYGHLAGDTVLVAVAQRLAANVRDGDLVARFGGEEFAVLMPNVPVVPARRAAERLRRAVADVPVVLPDGQQVRVTISGGVAPHRPNGTLDDLMGRADAALYRAKAAGRDRIVVDATSTGEETPASAAR